MTAPTPRGIGSQGLGDDEPGSVRVHSLGAESFEPGGRLQVSMESRANACGPDAEGQGGALKLSHSRMRSVSVYFAQDPRSAVFF